MKLAREAREHLWWGSAPASFTRRVFIVMGALKHCADAKRSKRMGGAEGGALPSSSVGGRRSAPHRNANAQMIKAALRREATDDAEERPFCPHFAGAAFREHLRPHDDTCSERRVSEYISKNSVLIASR